ncbi:PREDICTED: pentatricopeptide repeat-containing protein At4g22760-like [Camelina sativa]|uniref:Pentatricopeptide repeat-containing protein At4g22760-like n=1 Tax=Camelina sativa TaxID=90675 RepID=A0ABM1QQN1_CAMSA|nr:PREDICTED: pentatricopeptide repeat-containing protein At4g22760-like [Camelina sativa]
MSECPSISPLTPHIPRPPSISSFPQVGFSNVGFEAEVLPSKILVNRFNHLESILVHQTLQLSKEFSRNVVNYVKRILKGFNGLDSFSWGCLVRFLSQHRKFKETVAVYIEMHNSEFLQTGLVGLYSRLGYIEMAKRAFDDIAEKNTVSWNSLLQGYLESGNLDEARRVFDKIPEKDVVLWNLIISSYAKKR